MVLDGCDGVVMPELMQQLASCQLPHLHVHHSFTRPGVGILRVCSGLARTDRRCNIKCTRRYAVIQAVSAAIRHRLGRFCSHTVSLRMDFKQAGTMQISEQGLNTTSVGVRVSAVLAHAERLCSEMLLLLDLRMHKANSA